MNELDDVWRQMLAESESNARAAGRDALADYLALKATNDQLRERAVRWLSDSFIELASEANRQNPAITIERDEPHSFRFEGANLVGTQLRLRQGVRGLTLETGWTRTPADGFMRGGALAAARIKHFGFREFNADLALRRTDELPRWFTLSTDGSATSFEADDLRRHFETLLGR